MQMLLILLNVRKLFLIFIPSLMANRGKSSYAFTCIRYIKPFISKEGEQVLTKAQMEMTVDVMAHSLVYWVQDLVSNNLLAEKGRIFAMTSSGGHAVIPSMVQYQQLKAALESHVRQLTAELGYMKVAVNAIMAGVTDTPALRKIPGSLPMLEVARRKNPRERLTTPEDIAKVISLLCRRGETGYQVHVINADGGEDIVNFIGQGKKSENSIIL
jgi:enoyl-[acyl-carrier protein] reductase III